MWLPCSRLNTFRLSNYAPDSFNSEIQPVNLECAARRSLPFQSWVRLISPGWAADHPITIECYRFPCSSPINLLGHSPRLRERVPIAILADDISHAVTNLPRTGDLLP